MATAAATTAATIAATAAAMADTVLALVSGGRATTTPLTLVTLTMGTTTAGSGARTTAGTWSGAGAPTTATTITATRLISACRTMTPRPSRAGAFLRAGRR